MRLGITAIALVLAAHAARGEQPVYRILDERAGVTYSDRSAGPASARVQNYQAPEPTPAAQRALGLRGETERLYYERLRAQWRTPPRVVIFDPRSQPRPETVQAREFPRPRLRGRWDPSLPDSPPPSLERHYHYGGR